MINETDYSPSQAAVQLYSEQVPLTDRRRYTAQTLVSGPIPEDGGLFDYWRIIFRRKLLILGFGVLLAVLAGIFATLQTPTFRSQISIEFGSPTAASIDMKDFGGGGPLPEAAMDAFIQTQAEVLQDDVLLSQVVSELGMANRPEFRGGRGALNSLKSLLGRPADKPLSPETLALHSAVSNLKVRPLAQAHIIRVSYESTDPKLAASFVNTLADEFIKHDIEFRTRSAIRLSEWLRTQIDEVKSKLERSEQEMQSYARATGLVFTQETNRASEAGLQAVQQELSNSRAELAAKKAQFDIANGTRPEWLPQALSDPGFQDSRTKLAELRRQLAELSSMLTPDNYKVKRVQAQITELEALQKNELTNLRKRIDNEYGIAQARESAMSANYQRQARGVADEGSKLIHYNTLKRDVESARDLHSALAKKLQDASIAAALKTTNVHVLGEASPPLQPFKPNVFLSICLGFLGGVAFAVLFVMMRKGGNEKIQLPGEISSLTGIRELASIPRIKGLGRPLGIESLGVSLDVEMVAWKGKNSVMGELFREATTSLLFRSRGGVSPQAIVFTSPGPLAGKSAMVSNIGIALADLGRRVLLIDGDMRRPTLHKAFGILNERGLSNLLSESQRITPSLTKEFITATAVPRLWLLGSGPKSDELAALLHNGRFSELIQAVRQEFDVILIDTPPVLPVADARYLARAADGAILVVRAGRTARQDAVLASERLVFDHIPMIGAVLNYCDPKLPSLSYYEQYESAGV